MTFSLQELKENQKLPHIMHFVNQFYCRNNKKDEFLPLSDPFHSRKPLTYLTDESKKVEEDYIILKHCIKRRKQFFDRVHNKPLHCTCSTEIYCNFEHLVTECKDTEKIRQKYFKYD